MMQCSVKAYAKCPDRALCDSRSEAVFTEDSECAAFNRSMEDTAMTNADRDRPVTEQQAEIILAYAENNMNAVAAGKKIYMSESNVSYHLAQIKEQTGRNPKRFYDLCYLVGIAAQQLGGTYGSNQN